MKKLLIFLMCLFLTSCASMQPVVNVDDQNMFESKNPNLKLLIDKDLKYLGEFKYLKKGNGFVYDKEYHNFNAGSKKYLFVIICRIPTGSSFHWLPINLKEGEKGVISQYKTVKLAGKHWKPFLQLINPGVEETDFFSSKNITIDQYYLSKNYVRNITEKIQVYV
ncbi:MAG: hypothetical protein KAI40_06555 [Desulfobacterales bacterium]|nr:hypothetical protein [Desulfobacterales bacterium]